MRYHAIDHEADCPHCGRTALAYESSGVRGDLYRCSVCHGRAVHRRPNGSRACGVTPLFEYGRFGGWTACQSGQLMRGARPAQGDEMRTSLGAGDR